MNQQSYFSNLRPSEKRLVVVIAAVSFVVLNFWFVFPHFSDWGQVQFRMQNAQDKLRRYQNEIAQTNTYAKAVRKMEGEGYSVPPEDQALHFASAVQSQAAQSRVNIITTSRILTKTNRTAFIEQSQTINVQGEEKALVDFLYRLGAGNSLIRVRDLGLRPDPPRQHLQANVKLVASYQKNPPKPAAASAKRPATTSRAALPTAKK